MYRLGRNGEIYREADGALIPKDVKNRDYNRYISWSDDNTPTPYPLELRRQDRTQEIEKAGFLHINTIGGDERNKMRTLMNAVRSIDSYTKPGGGTRNAALDSLASDADRIEQTHILIEQAKIELETHNDPENYPMPVWP